MELERSEKRTLILANRLLENTNPGKPNLCEQKRAGIRNKGKKTMVHKGEMRWNHINKEEKKERKNKVLESIGKESLECHLRSKGSPTDEWVWQ